MKKVAIVGGGVSGLLALKSLLEEGIKATLFEKTGHIGGIWNYAEENGSYYTLSTNTSKEMTMISDFPHKEIFSRKERGEGGNFHSHFQFMEYLEEYAKTFQLYRYIRFNCPVVSVIPTSTSTWLVSWEEKGERKQKEYEKVVVCSGKYNKEYYPPFYYHQNRFKGDLFHSKQYRTPHRFFSGDQTHTSNQMMIDGRITAEEFKGRPRKSICIVGIGNSAMDLLCDILLFSDPSISHPPIYLSFRNSSYMLPCEVKVGEKFVPIDQYLPTRSRSLAALASELLSISSDLTNLFISKGMKEPEGDMRRAHFTLLKNGEVIRRALENNEIIILPEIKQLNEHSLHLTHPPPHTPHDIPVQTIALCTGYSSFFPFLSDDRLAPYIQRDQQRDQQHDQQHQIQLYKKIFHPTYPSLSFIGQIDALGPILAIAEMQSRLMAAVYANQIQLPNEEVMVEEVAKEAKLSLGRRSPTLVQYVGYMDALSLLLRCSILLPDDAPSFLIDLYRHGPVFPSFYRYSGPHSKLFIPSLLSKL